MEKSIRKMTLPAEVQEVIIEYARQNSLQDIYNRILAVKEAHEAYSLLTSLLADKATLAGRALTALGRELTERDEKIQELTLRVQQAESV